MNPSTDHVPIAVVAAVYWTGRWRQRGSVNARKAAQPETASRARFAGPGGQQHYLNNILEQDHG